MLCWIGSAYLKYPDSCLWLFFEHDDHSKKLFADEFVSRNRLRLLWRSRRLQLSARPRVAFNQN